jgi:hypothetical protein
VRWCCCAREAAPAGAGASAQAWAWGAAKEVRAPELGQARRRPRAAAPIRPVKQRVASLPGHAGASAAPTARTAVRVGARGWVWQVERRVVERPRAGGAGSARWRGRRRARSNVGCTIAAVAGAASRAGAAVCTPVFRFREEDAKT